MSTRIGVWTRRSASVHAQGLLKTTSAVAVGIDANRKRVHLSAAIAVVCAEPSQLVSYTHSVLARNRGCSGRSWSTKLSTEGVYFCLRRACRRYRCLIISLFPVPVQEGEDDDDSFLPPGWMKREDDSGNTCECGVPLITKGYLLSLLLASSVKSSPPEDVDTQFFRFDCVAWLETMQQEPTRPSRAA